MPMFTTLFVMTWLAVSAPDTFARHDALELRSVNPSGNSVPQYGRFELTLDVRATYDNPFDPEDVDVYALFRSPSGKSLRVNGFFTQPCSRRLVNDMEYIDPLGEPFWQIRFAAPEEGTWRYQVFVKDRTGSCQSPEAAVAVMASASPGFIRTNPKAPQVFAFENGHPYVAIGENMCWATGRGTVDFEMWLASLAQGGGNWIRFFMDRWHCCLEWTPSDQRAWDQGQFYGLGKYNLCNAWRLDTILDMAERNGVYVMVCLGMYSEFTEGGFFSEGIWPMNPYNAANGGPCKKPEEFWTNEQARKLYKQRLRYLAARYGWRTGVFAWEFWNEAYPTTPWVQEMAQFLKGTGPYADQPADPYRHLVSTSYGTADIWGLPEIDFSMTHQYGEGNLADAAITVNADAVKHAAFNKPHLMAEFGIDWRSSDDKYDTSV